MNIIDELVATVALPRMLPVRQLFADERIGDVAAVVRGEIARPEIAARLRPGMSVAVGVGSRGVAELPRLVRATIAALEAHGARPFIVPAMGSHGGATAEGQTALLAKLGVTEESAGCPIRSSMETVEMGRLPGGLPIYMDSAAMAADGIVVINRIKPHTSFSGTIESGLAKMITIGLGKQRGAESCHAYGFGTMAEHVIEMARFKLAHAPVLFGLATVENAYDKPALIEAVPGERILEREPELLAMARANMPRIRFRPLDVLVIDRMGKEFSGTGMDPNITGRATTPYVRTSQEVGKMAVLDLSDNGGGNATGIGLADVCTRRLFDRIDFPSTYANCITSTVLAGARIPMILDNDRDAIRVAIKTCNAQGPGGLRMVRLANTLHLEEILISEALLPEAMADPGIEVLGDPRPMAFDAAGNLARPVSSHG
ncbi:nickel pincer cofactor-dependent isomerase, group 22 [Limimaricola litoreus]|uniref:Nickel-dependent lactate racemase n=1 Tax=Limimaricola litoreus TaxID=2955316 RepID=A0A9X2FP40_9RHOB|nr:lactate racemase domain-containing protein [Limimaricola litoreus]MCP1168452.1 nickel-dependent lactate racemase [Limimaricola litoreus]